MIKGVAHFIPETEDELTRLMDMAKGKRVYKKLEDTLLEPASIFHRKHRKQQKKSYKRECPFPGCGKKVQGLRGLAMHKNWHEGRGHFGRYPKVKSAVDAPVEA